MYGCVCCSEDIIVCMLAQLFLIWLPICDLLLGGSAECPSVLQPMQTAPLAAPAIAAAPSRPEETHAALGGATFDPGQAQTRSAASLLYTHALESIFAFASLRELAAVLRVCRSWRAAVLSMRPIEARLPRKSMVYSHREQIPFCLLYTSPSPRD